MDLVFDGALWHRERFALICFWRLVCRDCGDFRPLHLAIGLN